MDDWSTDESEDEKPIIKIQAVNTPQPVVNWISDGDEEKPGVEWVTDEEKPDVGWVTDEEKPDVGWVTDEEEAPAPAPVHNPFEVPIREVSEAGPSQTNSVAQFIAMGFSKEMVEEAIKQNREGDTENVLETLLTLDAIEKTPEDPSCSRASDRDFEDEDFSDMDDFGFEDFTDELCEKDRLVSTLVDMGFLADEACSAIDRCGQTASILELADSINAAQMQEDSGDELWESSSSGHDESSAFNCYEERKRRISESGRRNKRIRFCENFRKRMGNTDALQLPNPMIGFGLPYQRPCISHRNLPEAVMGPPFFYYENVALAPKGVWETISRFLYDIQPEFVDSKFFSAAARKRGYIHNLPIEGRFPLLPIPAKTIHEVFPSTRDWCPSWDTRTHFNCLQTCHASAKLTERIRARLERYSDTPPLEVQKLVLEQCRKWNLVWVGLHKLAPLEPDEIEKLLGFPANHTRGLCRTERYKSLGNSFQIDTVAYHLSVLKRLFPGGINVLSLFSGIGGAEVALHRLGIRLKTVVSVELSDVNRSVVKSWWGMTGQTGTLIDIADVQQLHGDRIQKIISTYGEFDLVIGGSPCNNLAGSNRHHRDGLEGKHSSLFYDYFRILDLVMGIMGKKR